MIRLRTDCQTYGTDCQTYGIDCQTYGIDCQTYGIDCQTYGMVKKHSSVCVQKDNGRFPFH